MSAGQAQEHIIDVPASEVDEEYSFSDALVDLVYFCAEGKAEAWRQIWYEWTYSECVEFSIQKKLYSEQMMDELKDLKSPEAMMIYLLMRK